jgi:hypothetical protein
MKLYRLHPKSSAQRTPAPEDLADTTPTTADAQPAGQPDTLGTADFAGMLHGPKGDKSFRFFMAPHWRFFLFGVGASGMLLLFADRLALVLAALKQVLAHTGLPIGP